MLYVLIFDIDRYSKEISAGRFKKRGLCIPSHITNITKYYEVLRSKEKSISETLALWCLRMGVTQQKIVRPYVKIFLYYHVLISTLM